MKCKQEKLSKRLILAIGLAVLLGGSTYGEAAVRTTPLAVTDKNQTISDDFNFTTDKDNFSVIKADSSVSGGTITIDSKTIHAEGDNLGQLSKNAIIRTTGSSVYGKSGMNLDPASLGLDPGYEGTINLADGLTITGTIKGDGTSTMGIYEEGYDKLGTVVNNVNKNGFHRYIYSNNTGKPAGVTVNLGKNTKIDLTGIQLANRSGTVEDYYFRNFAICNDGSTLNVGDGSSLSATAYGRYAVTPAALYNSKYGVTHLGNNVTLSAKGVLTEKTSGNGAEVYGLISRHDHVGDDKSDVNGRQTVTAGDNLTVNANLSCHDIDYENPYSLAVIGAEIVNTDLTTGKNTTIHTTQDDKGLGTYGLFVNKESTATLGDGFQTIVDAKGTTYGVYGLYAQRSRNDKSGNVITFQGKAVTTVNAAGSHQAFGTALYGSTLTAQGPYTINLDCKDYATQAVGLYLAKDPYSGNASTVDTTGGKLTIGVSLQGDAVKDPGYYGTGTAQYVSDTAHLNTLANDGGTASLGAADLSLTMKGNMTEKTEMRGLGTLNGGTTTATGPVNLTVTAENTGTKAATQLVYGVANTGSTVKLQGPVTASVTAKNVGEAYGVRTTDKGTTEIGDGSTITVNTDADKTAVVRSEQGGVTTFTGGATLGGVATALESTGKDDDGSGSQINLKEAGTKVITGDLFSEDGGSIDLALNDGQSVLTGKSTVDGGITNVAVTDGARWNMTGDSNVTSLDLENGGTVNLKANTAYETLTADTFKGQGGNFLLKTDLASQTDGDKVTITSADPGSSATVQVSDASLTNGREVTGVKNLLLITDASKNATFTGKALDRGGLWDVTPTIQRGDTVKDAAGNIVGDATQWYLTKVEKKVNHDTQPLVVNVDNSYALYRDSLDTLRQRMGDLRLRNKKSDVSGLWARNRYGSYAGEGLENKENRFQLGYDWSADRKSVYGILGERGIGSPSYAHGSGKDHSLAWAAYGTWFGDNGSYTDVVARTGRDDAQIRTYGPYADRADFRAHDASVSVEYGRTHKLDAKGLFLEPEAQFQWGHLGSTHYTTARGKDVNLAGYNSAVGRLGFVFGQRRTEVQKPFDYYVKADVLHEFGGSRAYHLAAADGERLDGSTDYRDTWFELGLGGTARVNKATYLYADVSRSYGSRWNKKWQANVGVDWTF